MTRRANARLAGIAYLLYIAVAFPAMLLSDRATAGDGWAAKLSTLVQRAGDLRVSAVLSLIGCFCALTLAVTLYAITRERDRDLAMLALTCRVAEGVSGGVGIAAMLGLLVMVTTRGANATDPLATQAVGAFVFAQAWIATATFFAVGSTVFSWLLLRGRMVPAWIAGLGVVASALLVVAVPLQVTGVISGPLTQLMWLPCGVFEVALAIWFIVKGVAAPATAEAR